jgi:hypothetical protein
LQLLTAEHADADNRTALWVAVSEGQVRPTAIGICSKFFI